MVKTLVVLGANSFSGQDFVDLALDDPDTHIIGVSRSAERSSAFLRYRRRSDLTRYRYRQLDMNRQMADLLRLLDQERPEGIVNFAAQSEVAPSWEHPEHWFQTNCVALAKLVNHLRRRDYLARYVHISSPEAYGNCVGQVREDAPLHPSTPYAASKAAADMLLSTYARQYGFPLLTIRATNVYGARQQLFKIIPRTAIYLKIEKTIDLHGGGRAVKSYIHVRDVSRGVKAVLDQGRTGAIYHLSPDSGVAVRDVVAMMCRHAGRDFSQATRTVAERPGQDAAYVIDSSRARAELGWAPAISLEEGLSEVIDWVAGNWRELGACALDYQHKE
jgi:dTDP-glucose 4,6-dehydratase